MIKLLIMGVFVAVAGAAGYFGEQFFRPTQAPAPEHDMAAQDAKPLFKLPLGKFTMQVVQPQRILHLVFDIDVYVQGSAAFQDINGAVGRARLRDATVTAIAELSKTDLSLSEPMEDESRKTDLAAKIVRKLYVNFPIVRTARMKTFHANVTLRD